MNSKEHIDIRGLTLKNGLSYPNDRELLMMILGTGTKKLPVEDMANEILKVISATNPEHWVEKMQSINGVGKGKALAVAAALELGRRQNRNPQAKVERATDVIPFIRHFAINHTEHFVCVTVNGANEILNIRVLCIGAGNMAVLKPREIFCDALMEHASGIILAHNHPGGNPSPSNADIATTHKLCKAASILGIALLDHIIITKNSHFSFMEHGMLPSME